MSLRQLPDGWRQFGAGHRWRCAGPKFLCEVDEAGNVPSYIWVSSALSKLRRTKSMYAGRLKLGVLDSCGTALDILAANAMTESFGTVPSPLSTSELRRVYTHHPGIDAGVKADAVVRAVSDRAKYLERREPGYIDPVVSAGRVSVGAHHVLISTALRLREATDGKSAKESRIRELVCRVPAESITAAQLAVDYFNAAYARHLNEPPLLAATYNAGSPRLDPRNDWNLRQYGEHVDRWVRYYNTSRLM